MEAKTQTSNQASSVVVSYVGVIVMNSNAYACYAS